MAQDELRTAAEADSVAPPAKRLPGTYSAPAYIAVALMLVVGVVMPLLTTTDFNEYHPVFVNLKLLDDEGTPLLMKVLLVYPAAAAVAVIIAAVCARGVLRALLIHLLGAFPFIVYYADETVRRGLGSLLGLPEQFNPFLPFGGALALAGVAGLFVGNRVRRVYPESRAAALAGGLGGAYFFLSLIVPLEPAEHGAYPIFAPFKMMFEEKGLWAWQIVGFSRILTMLLLAVASIIALQNVVRRPGAALRARLSGRMWLWHLLVLIAAPFVVLLVLYGRAITPAGTIPVEAALTLKTAFTTLGFLFLVLMGTVDLLVTGAHGFGDGESGAYHDSKSSGSGSRGVAPVAAQRDNATESQSIEPGLRE